MSVIKRAHLLFEAGMTELPSVTPNRYDGQAVQIFHLQSNNRTSRCSLI